MCIKDDRLCQTGGARYPRKKLRGGEGCASTPLAMQARVRKSDNFEFHETRLSIRSSNVFKSEMISIESIGIDNLLSNHQ